MGWLPKHRKTSTRIRYWLAKSSGIPTTRQGRRRKLGRLSKGLLGSPSGGGAGCLVVFVVPALLGLAGLGVFLSRLV